MKAAVIFNQGEVPQYIDIPKPAIQNDDELFVTIKAVAIKHFDKIKAGGQEYSANGNKRNAKVIGSDGVGVLADGTRVYAFSGSGMMAEKAIVLKSRMIKLPNGIDDITAAALPNAVAGSSMALLYRAAMRPGETVLINGATGFTGKMAVQVAKHHGAGKIIVTGRNEQTLQSLISLGADDIITIKGDNETFIKKIKKIHSISPIDIVVDYLWGLTAEFILTALKGNGSPTHKTRYVSVGAVTGDMIRLSSENLRNVNLYLSGSGLGSWTNEEMIKLFSEIIPEMLQLAADNILKVDTVKVSLDDIGKVWNMEAPGGKRYVVSM